MTAHVAVGALCGLSWAAGVRGLMVQLAGPEAHFTWLGTFGGLLVPGTAIGALLGRAEHRRAGPPALRWRLASLPLPAVVPALLLGVGSVPVAYLALPMRPELDPTTPLGAWAATTFCAFLLVLAAGSALPLRRPGARLGRWGLLLLGGLGGLAWGCGLRGFMTRVAGAEASMTWTGTFGWIVVPAVVAGSALGWAEHVRRTGGRRGWRWFALSPLTFAALLLSELTEPFAIFEDGIGGGAIGVPLMGMAGGYALSGRGPRWARLVCGLLALAAVPIWALTATSIGGPALGVDTPHGLWLASLFWSFLAVLALAASIPHRQPWPKES